MADLDHRKWNDRFRVLTWNIHAGVGPDGRYNLGRIIEIIRQHEPDIIALQEVDSRGRSHDLPLDALKLALGHHAAEARTIAAPDGHYGHVLMSRWPMRTTLLHDLSVRRREPRFAIEAVVSLPRGDAALVGLDSTLTIFSTHLGLRYVECREQVRRLVEILRRVSGRVILMGDFNDWHHLVRRAMRPLLPGCSLLRTFPARYPVLALDGLYWRPQDAATGWWVDLMGKDASDHLPLVADFVLGSRDRVEGTADNSPRRNHVTT